MAALCDGASSASCGGDRCDVLRQSRPIRDTGDVMPPRPRRGPITSIPWGCGQVVHPRAGHVCTIRFSVHLQTQPFWSLRHQPSRAKAAAAGHTATKREQAMSHDVPVLQCPRSRPWHRRWQAPESPDQDNEFKQQATKGRTEPQVPKGSSPGQESM